MPFSFSVLVFQSVSVDLLGVHEGLVKSGDPWDFPGGSVVKNLPANAVGVQLLSCVGLFVTPTAHQALLPFTISQSLLKHMSIESVMPSNHLILCCSLLLLSSIFPKLNRSYEDGFCYGYLLLKL